MTDKPKRGFAKVGRMILDLPPEVQMAIRLRAAKNRITTGQVVTDAVRAAFPGDVADAVAAKEVEAFLAEGGTQ